MKLILYEFLLPTQEEPYSTEARETMTIKTGYLSVLVNENIRNTFIT